MINILLFCIEGPGYLGVWDYFIRYLLCGIRSLMAFLLADNVGSNDRTCYSSSQNKVLYLLNHFNFILVI
jgi:hypothetical protein